MDFSNMRAFLDRLPELTGLPGGEVAVWHENKEVFTHVFGVKDHETREPLQGGEPYYFYSATKVITCACAMQCMERGLFALNDPLSWYIPEFAHMMVKNPDGEPTPALRPIKIWNLMTMTSGLNYDLNSPEIRQVREETDGRCPTVEVARRAISKQILSFEPGEKWQYNLGHDVLAAVIEIVSGMPFAEFVKKNIFEPLGMENSFFHSTEELRARMPSQYAAQEMPLVRIPLENIYELGSEYESGGAGLISCASDYIRFASAMANGGVGATGKRILCPESIDLMRTNCVGNRMDIDCGWAQLAGYGYGFGVRTLISKEKGGALSHLGEFGWAGAHGLYVMIDPEERVALTYVEHRGSYKPIIQPRLRNLTYTCLRA